MIIFARYDGSCHRCGGAIRAGENVEWDRNRGVTFHLPTACWREGDVTWTDRFHAGESVTISYRNLWTPGVVDRVEPDVVVVDVTTTLGLGKGLPYNPSTVHTSDQVRIRFAHMIMKERGSR